VGLGPSAMTLVGTTIDWQRQFVSSGQEGFRQKPSLQKRFDLQFVFEPQVPPQRFGSPGQTQSALLVQEGLRQ